MVEIVGIQFENGTRLYYFEANGYRLDSGDFAIVETVRGLELGKVVVANRMVEKDDIAYELKPIIRQASKYDLEAYEKYKTMAPKSFETFKRSVQDLDLPMKPLYCEYTIDGQKVVFYYTADDRVDFRELLKILTPKFKCRVELRQISSREAARYIGGIGNCGRVICCKSCLAGSDFVTMKMAKDQNMSLNKDKINGLCDKLLCCIAYEHEMYEAMKKEFPQPGDTVKTPNCDAAKVISVDYMRRLIIVNELNNQNNTVYKAEELLNLVVCNPSVEPGLEEVVTSEEPQTNKVKKVYVFNKNNKQGKKKHKR